MYEMVGAGRRLIVGKAGWTKLDANYCLVTSLRVLLKKRLTMPCMADGADQSLGSLGPFSGVGASPQNPLE